ncbi:cytochrome c maturation protein CcmE domain-containing protein [Archaeoglobus profundus]|uniref:Nucleic acid binding OB-fold tRNA/helicase-type n=1 Tax=Archaeoglobus profundus (strain DSM 5631 / JCM 9629 / NBRC 100127 / Av18) TaxID=572546 RepID=D2RHD0_ARCPA|nr:cytochrome c maturation protein CcmE [Archaeoglobus profundus]ADB57705.1 hypothetical protein Arcpr_0640 [Archaeoglobus profundus DSM 5631]
MNKFVPVIALTMVFGLIGYLTLSSTSYLSVSDLKEIKDIRRVVVIGNVTKGSVKFEDHLEFRINDGVWEVKVIYPSYVRLDNASGYGTVVVEGTYYPENKTIFAVRIESKCPSKQVVEAYKGV